MTASIRSKPFVFVSHAKHDKAHTPLLASVVAALIEKGFKIWLDDPRALGFSDADIATHFHDLRGDGRWEDQIDDALEDAACILVCVSRKFCERYEADTYKKEGVIWREVSQALTARKAVVCRIDDVAFAEIPVRIGEAQIIDLQADPGRRQALLEDVGRVMERTLQRRLGSLGEAPARDPFLPFLANRQSQEQKAEVRLRETLGQSVRALIAKAPRNECPDQFMDRLRRHTSARVLGEGRCCEVLKVDWPRVDRAEEFDGWYENSLRSALKLPDKDIGAVLRRARQAPLLVQSVIDFDDWHKGSARIVQAWVDYWSRLSTAGSGAPLLPVLMVVTEAAPPGWKPVPALRNQRGVSTRQAWKDLGKLAKAQKKRPAASGFGVELLDILGPLYLKDADDWRRKHIEDTSSPLYLDLGRQFETFFAGKARKTGISMEDWNNRLLPVLAKDTTSLRINPR